MIYLGTCPNEPGVKMMLDAHGLGLMCQPASNRPIAGWIWAADNGCFAKTWDKDKWAAWLTRPHPRSGCLFATVPDVVGDHHATLARFWIYRDLVDDLRYPIAFVAQDGSGPDLIPWGSLDCLFVGGTTEWKQSEIAFDIAARARAEGKWVHVGRVNSKARLASWQHHADSADGTFLAFGPKTNLPRLVAWLDHISENPTIWETQ